MPTPDAPFRLGTRRSPLAMAQATEARDRLCAAHGWPREAVELVTVIASGDRVQDRPLAEIGGKALWTRELDRWLAEGRIDAAVHSMKDVETIRPPELALGAVLPRADVADVLLGASSIEAIAPGARLGTSAPRRAAQMLHRRPDIEVVGFRGNVATRMAKLEAGEADVTLLAAAGLERLGEEAGVRLEPENWLPAPAQGAIGLECRADDADARVVLAAIDDWPSHARVLAERALLAGLGGTCHSPVAALTRIAGDRLTLTGAVFSENGAERVAESIEIDAGEPEAARELADELLRRAPPSITRLFTG